jgi:hypothetical protein
MNQLLLLIYGLYLIVALFPICAFAVGFMARRSDVHRDRKFCGIAVGLFCMCGTAVLGLVAVQKGIERVLTPGGDFWEGFFKLTVPAILVGYLISVLTPRSSKPTKSRAVDVVEVNSESYTLAKKATPKAEGA